MPAQTAGGLRRARRDGLDSGPDAVTWRLVGANNHELGRSPYVHGTLADCCEAVERLQERIEEAAPLVTMSTGTSAGATGTGAWTWQLALDGDCAAVSTRTFRRQRECRHSCQLFLAAAAGAQVASAITYTRRLRGLRLPGAGDVPGPALRGGGLR
ncbi:hypothetical protein [Streptomyces sp. NBC_00503]|uniref:hypothetical protein n=1 Tax=Streptomyces sp. NBC_00503 TaxID=2903659 RepID=UPI002E80817D|nr:hypothetical protein [Streptomyces sp. NBC_00503]WUD80052.1 hypothetical protein OG490_05455 [Streptomyces sp. NBC_00503]